MQEILLPFSFFDLQDQQGNPLLARLARSGVPAACRCKCCLTSRNVETHLRLVQPASVAGRHVDDEVAQRLHAMHVPERTS